MKALARKFALVGAVLSISFFSACSSTEESETMVEPVVMQDQQQQSDVKSRSDYTADDWFYDYYDVSEDEIKDETEKEDFNYYESK